MAISDAMAADLRALAEATADEDGVDLRASLNDLLPFGGCRGSRLPRTGAHGGLPGGPSHPDRVTAGCRDDGSGQFTPYGALPMRRWRAGKHGDAVRRLARRV
jgi:hypothetical protein